MTDADWTQVRIEIGLMQEVDKIIQETKVFGARKYWSRTDFVKEAVLKLLEEYVAADSNNSKRKKDSGEEILVTGK